MKDESRRRLNRLILMRRLKIAAVAVSIALALTGAFGFLLYEQSSHRDKVVETRLLDGTITGAQRGYSRSSGFTVDVLLDDGRQVSALSRLARIPIKGEHARVKMSVFASGRSAYSVTQITP